MEESLYCIVLPSEAGEEQGVRLVPAVPGQRRGQGAQALTQTRACRSPLTYPPPPLYKPNIAAYAYQDVHVWSAL